MFKEFVCNFTKSELEEIYSREGMTLKKMCEIVGCKSDITMSKILRKNGIDTNQNQKLAYKKRGNRTDAEFKEYLTEEYCHKLRSMTNIAKELGISWVIVSRYLDKYNIPKRDKSEQQSGYGAPVFKGGIRKTEHGYILVHFPDHPFAIGSTGCVYAHRIIAEGMLGRYLKHDEVVHHIDMNKQNNNPNNLVVLTNRDHLRLHAMLRSGMSYEEAIKHVKVITK